MTAFPIIPSDGIIGYMDVLVFSIQGGKLNSKIRLFQNDYTPNRGTVPASFVESTAGGFGSKPLSTPANKGVDFSGRNIWLFPPTIFTASGFGLPAIVYGYWVDFTDPITAATRVLWCQRFGTPQVAIAIGDTINFTASFGGKQC